MEPAGRDSEPAGMASEPAERASKPAERASEPAERASDPAGRGLKPAGRAPKPGGRPQGGTETNKTKTEKISLCGDAIGLRPLRGRCPKRKAREKKMRGSEIKGGKKKRKGIERAGGGEEEGKRERARGESKVNLGRNGRRLNARRITFNPIKTGARTFFFCLHGTFIVSLDAFLSQ